MDQEAYQLILESTIIQSHCSNKVSKCKENYKKIQGDKSKALH